MCVCFFLSSGLIPDYQLLFYSLTRPGGGGLILFLLCVCLQVSSWFKELFPDSSFPEDRVMYLIQKTEKAYNKKGRMPESKPEGDW